jgi:hypothetical protein
MTVDIWKLNNNLLKSSRLGHRWTVMDTLHETCVFQSKNVLNKIYRENETYLISNDFFWDVRTDVSEELSASTIRVTRIGELGTLAGTSVLQSVASYS